MESTKLICNSVNEHCAHVRLLSGRYGTCAHSTEHHEANQCARGTCGLLRTMFDEDSGKGKQLILPCFAVSICMCIPVGQGS